VDQYLDRYRNHLIVGLLALLVAAGVWIALEQRRGPDPLEVRFGEPTPGSGGPIQVYVTGAVERPGVYQLTDGDRAIDALAAAGGATGEADLEAVNLAKRLHDEDQLVVPRLGDVVSGVAGIARGPPVNLNTASAEELEALPGIGPTYAQRIIDSRASAGPFRTPDELLTRQLLPQATYDRIKALVQAP